MEIERTNKAEDDLGRLMAKYGKKLKQLQESHQAEVRSCDNAAADDDDDEDATAVRAMLATFCLHFHTTCRFLARPGRRKMPATRLR